MPTGNAESLEALVRAGAARSRSRMLLLILLGIAAAILGLGAALWSWQVQRSSKEAAPKAAAAAASQAIQEVQANQQQAAELLQKGAAQAHAGHYAAADQLYDEALKIEPNSATAFQLKGYLQLRQKNVSAAIPLLEKATALNPLDPWGHYNLALALYRSGDTAAAVDQVRDLLNIAPNFKTTIAQDGQFAKLRKEPAMQQLLAQTQ